MSPESPKRNIAGRIAGYFIASKLTPLIILMAFLAGALAMQRTPREENPEIVVPAANIIVSKPGATPKEVERLIVDPLESILHGMPGVAHTYGMATDSVGVVTVRFKVGQNKINSLVKLYDRIMSHLDEMPPGTLRPLVKPVDVDDVPIVTVSLASNRMSGLDLRHLGVTVLDHLRRVANTSASYVLGGRKRQIDVTLRLGRMRADNITLPDIEKVLQATNVEVPSGSFIRDNHEATVRSGGMLRNAHAVGDIVVGTQNHRPVFLRDIARITDGPGPLRATHYIGFGPAYSGRRARDFETDAVTVALAKRAGTNAVTVAHAVLARLRSLRQSVIPPWVHVNVTRNDGHRANEAVNTLIDHLAIAIVTVVALLVLFLGWRAAAIVTITIPLILFITLAVGLVAGQTINRITLFSLILALGLLVDDSIVVIENIFRHYAKNRSDRTEAAIAAVNEIGRPTNLATLAVILAFLPMFWVTGMMGPYMRPIPFNVPVAMLASLFIAYSIAPWAARLWLSGHDHGPDAAEPGPGWLERGYARAMGTLLRRRWSRWVFLLLILALLAAVLAMPVFRLVRFKMLPGNNTNTFDITVRTHTGSTLEDTDQVVRRIGDILRHTRYVTTFESSAGERGVVDFNGLLRGSTLKKGPTVGDVRVDLVDKRARPESSIAIVKALRPKLVALAQATHSTIKVVQEPPGPPVRATVMAELAGPDYAHLELMAQSLKRAFAATPHMVDVDDSVPHAGVQYTIRVDRTRAALAGVTPAEVAQTLKAYLGGYSVGTVHIANEREPVPIRFRIQRGDRTGPMDLHKVFFTNRAGNEVPLSAIASIQARPTPQPIFHKDQRPVVYVTGEISGGSPVYAVMHLWRYVKTHRMAGTKLRETLLAPPSALHYSLRWDGEMRLTLKVFRDLGSAFAVAIVLIYLLLVGYYRSFMIPVIVMGAIPLTIIGVFPGHAVLHQYFTATSMIGVIALAGIVVRNSLLLIDFILEYRRAGHPLEEAVLAAGVVRLRPILLTALAIILGTLVMIVDPVFGGLAISLIFGTFASTVLTLFVIPIGYYAYACHYPATP
ncbi:MAG TPA: efflux RND transporter permease subunit [Acidiferrobacteraceae bacterium]|nr:efflux RND transporter permease subunit [Acidiferrobacteraceae bacterium]